MRWRYLLTLILIWTASFGQTNYYLDSKAGSDSNSGLSPVAAWRTLNKCNEVIYTQGDSLLFARGGEWFGCLQPKGSGSRGNPVVIASYGKGEKPVLDAAGQIMGSGSSSATIRLFNQEYWVIRDLEVRNYLPDEVPRTIEVNNRSVRVNTPKYAILIEAEDYGVIHNFHFINLDICRVNGDMSTKDNGGIFLNILRNDNPEKWIKTKFDRVMVQECHFYDTDRTGWSNRSVWENRSLTSSEGDTLLSGKIHDWFPSTNIIITSNMFERSGANALIVRVADSPLIEYNVFSECAVKGSGNACFPFNCDNTLIQYNESRYTYYNTADDSWDNRPDVDAGGFDSDYNCKNTVIQYNYSHDNGFGGVLICSMGGGDRFNDGTVIRYNIFQNNRHHVFRVSGMPGNTSIYNNTIYTGKELADTRLIWHKNWRGWPENTQYVNNIFLTEGENPEIMLEESSGNSFSHNIFYGRDINGMPQDSAIIVSDPEFLAAGTGGEGMQNLSGYRLSDQSPATGSGLRYPDHARLDFHGVPIQPYGRIDRGAVQMTQSADTTQKKYASEQPYKVGFLADVSYLGSDREEKMDIYFPEDTDTTNHFPAIVMIHGGGWVGGDKAKKREKNIGPILAGQGYVCMSINYTLIKDRPVWHKSVADCKNAVRFARLNSKKYRIQPEKIGVIGGSAGGYLALMVGLTDPDSGIGEDAMYSGISARVQAVVDMYGKSNLMTAQETDIEGYPTGILKDGNTVRFLGGTRNEVPEIWKKASPVNHVSADDPPVMILHGRRDKTNDHFQAIELSRALTAVGVESFLYLLPEAGHTFSLQYDVNDKPLDHDLSEVVIDFFNHNLK